MTGPTEILEGRTFAGDLEDDADVVVVGSGAAGAVCAKLLQEAGLRVIVLEEGGYVPPERYGALRPSQTLRAMFRDAGTTAAIGIGDTPLMSILAGRAVGGSSLLTGGVTYRIPEKVLRDWVEDHGLSGFAPELLEEAYRSVEREVHVEEVPERMRSASTVLFGEGLARRGLALQPMRRNTRDCRGASRCNFGCPHGAKLSVDVTYLLDARRLGARVISDCKVTRVLVQGATAAGVEGRLLDEDGRSRGKATIRAKHVILAAGTLCTPLLLGAAGAGGGSGQLGRNLTLHPGARVAALFDREVLAWKGALQSAHCDALEADGLTLNSVFAPVNVLAAMFPGAGPAYTSYVARMRHLATFGVMVHDLGGGRVHRLPGGRSIITYRMEPRDKQRLLKGIRFVAQTFFDAGAREVLLPVFGLAPLKSADDLKVLDRHIPGRMFECVTFHPLGTARMGVDPGRSVVRPTGETWDVKELYVVDGSIFPTSIGVNTQLPIMTVATHLAWQLRERFGARAARGLPLPRREELVHEPLDRAAREVAG